MLQRSFRPLQWFDEDDPPEGFTEDTMMWVHRKVGDKWQVGYYTPDKVWVPEDKEYDSEQEAAQRLHFIHGGTQVNPKVQEAAERGFRS